MSSNPFISEREKLISAVETLPPDYLNGNAAPLLKIIRELKRSCRLENRIILAIARLDMSDPKAVAQFTANFQDYHASHAFDDERTHCHNIGRNSKVLLAPLRAGTDDDRARVKELEGLLRYLGSADALYLDEIGQVMDRALAAVNRINTHVQASLTDPTQLAAAQQEQQAFKDEFYPKFVELQAELEWIDEKINDLIDRL